MWIVFHMEPARSLDNEKALPVFTGRLVHLFERMHRLETWARAVTARNAVELGLSATEDILVADYLDAIAGSGLSKLDAFSSLVDEATTGAD